MGAMRHHVLFSLLSLASLGVACAMQTSHRASDILRSQLADDWKYWMTQYPEMATAFGFPGQNARWTDYSQALVDERTRYLKKSLERLSTIDPAQLAAADQVNYNLYRDLVETAVKGLDFHNDAVPIRGVIPHNLLMPINQLEGIQQDIPHVLALMPASTREDYENIISRLQKVGSLVDQTIALMEQGLALNMTPPKITLRDVPGQLEAQIVADPLKSPMLAAFTAWPAAIAEADRAPLAKRATDQYQQSVAPAFRKLHDFLTTRYLPACRETTGVNGLPNGAAMYAYNVGWHTTTHKSPEEIHEIGLAEVQRIRAAMDDILAFAELERFARLKLQHFSSGMTARLAYAVAFHAVQDVLILDEIFAVGDARFRARCQDRYQALIAAGHTVLLVTHDRGFVGFCNRVLLLEGGRIVMEDTPEQIWKEHLRLLEEPAPR